MMYRNVMEQLDTDRLRYDRYVFVGFNVLNRVETRFFQLLQDAGKAMFYWDYVIMMYSIRLTSSLHKMNAQEARTLTACRER